MPPPDRRRRLGQAALLLLAGAAGGYCFRLLGLPLPWTLGSMAAAALVALSGRAWTVPASLRDGARPVIGVMAGSAFTPAFAGQLLQLAPVLSGVLLFLALATVAGYGYFRVLCRCDRRTALLAAMPGGLGEITVLAADHGGDVRRLVVVHSVRIVAVVTAAPFLVGLLAGRMPTSAAMRQAAMAAPLSGTDALVLVGCGLLGVWIGRWFRSYGGLILAPLACSAAAHAAGLTHASPPYWLVAGVQVVIGCIAGARFAGLTGAEAREALRQGALWAGVIVLAAAALGGALAGRAGQSPAALFLALAPGGFAEMTAIAVAIGIEVAFVVTCQTLRLLAVLTLAPLALGLLRRRHR